MPVRPAVTIKYKDIEVRRYIKRVPGASKRATRRGINKGVSKASTFGNRAIRKRRNLKAKVVRDAMYIQKATDNNLSARVVVGRRGGPRSLRRYGAKVVGRRGRGNKARGNSPVAVRVSPGPQKIVQGAFIRHSDGAVFKRKTANRWPVRFLFGPSMWSTFERDDVTQDMIRFANREVPPLIEKEMVREFRRAYR